MKKPDISLFGSTASPGNWMRQIESIGDNVAKWERICVGPNPPDYTLPENHRFIYSEVKPVQCHEIGARVCKSNIIMLFPDDIIFEGALHPLDSLLDFYESQFNEKNYISPKYMLLGVDRSLPWPQGWQRLIAEDNDSPMMPTCGIMSKKLHITLGGFDRNFVTSYYDVDLGMRVIANGGKTILSEIFVHEIQELRKTYLAGEIDQPIDLQYVRSLWLQNGDWTAFQRACPVESFDDKNILTETQGSRKGRWK